MKHVVTVMEKDVYAVVHWVMYLSPNHQRNVITAAGKDATAVHIPVGHVQ